MARPALAGFTRWRTGSRPRTTAPWLALVLAVLTAAPASAQFAIDRRLPARLRSRFERRRQPTDPKFNDFVRQLGSADPEARLEAVKYFGSSNDPRALGHLIRAASDPDPRVQIKAIDLLAARHASEAVPLFVQLLFLRSTDRPLKQRLLAALGKIGDAQATPAIAEFLERDGDTALCATAIYALGEIGDRSALGPLDEFCDRTHHPKLRRLALDAIRKIKASKPKPVVVPALANDGAGLGGRPR